MKIDSYEVTFDDGTKFTLPSWTPPAVIKLLQGTWRRD